MVSNINQTKKSRQQIIHITEGVELSLGGTTQFVVSICEVLSERGFQAEIWAPRHNKARTSNLEPQTLKVPIRQFKTITPKFIHRCKGLYEALENLHLKPALIHQHGLWLDPYRIAARFAQKHNIPHIISLHGMLEPWSLKRSQWKKKLAWFIFQGRDIRLASCLHVATQREAENVRKLGIRTPIAVIPNGIQVTSRESQVAGRRSQVAGLKKFYPELADKKIILFLGRIHPVKGLDFFSKAWTKVADDFPDWHWVIAGPDEDNYQSELIKLFNELKIMDKVTFIGAVSGAEKFTLLNRSEFLVLPSYLESFGIVVLEALNEGIPVMASTNCPWSDLETYSCGWWLKQDIVAWESPLRKVMSMNRNILKEYGIRGKSLVREKYSQEQLVSSMIELYEWLLYHSEVPYFIYTN